MTRRITDRIICRCVMPAYTAVVVTVVLIVQFWGLL